MPRNEALSWIVLGKMFMTILLFIFDKTLKLFPQNDGIMIYFTCSFWQSIKIKYLTCKVWLGDIIWEDGEMNAHMMTIQVCPSGKN